MAPARHSGQVILYLDCDTGIDDAIALALLLGRPDVEILGIGTVSGNTSAAEAATNTLAVLALAGRDDIPVAVGGHDPLTGEYRSGASDVHGSNGIGGVELPPAARGPIIEPAADLLVRLARTHAGDLHVLATGPLTNLARALHAEPRLPELVAGVTVMGGAVRVPGNVTPHAEANIADDPAAAAAVVAAGWPLTLVPLDVTMNHRFTEPDRDALRATGSPLLTALADMLRAYVDYYEPVLGVAEVPLHDPLAAAVLVDAVRPAEAPVLPLRVDTGAGAERARIAEDPDAGHPVRVILSMAEPAAPAILAALLALA